MKSAMMIRDRMYICEDELVQSSCRLVIKVKCDIFDAEMNYVGSVVEHVEARSDGYRMMLDRKELPEGRWLSYDERDDAPKAIERHIGKVVRVLKLFK